eukprot:scaffold675157_cov41-Prasinocladus_malaysianus.AAC.1
MLFAIVLVATLLVTLLMLSSARQNAVNAALQAKDIARLKVITMQQWKDKAIASTSEVFELLKVSQIALYSLSSFISNVAFESVYLVGAAVKAQCYASIHVACPAPAMRTAARSPRRSSRATSSLLRWRPQPAWLWYTSPSATGQNRTSIPQLSRKGICAEAKLSHASSGCSGVTRRITESLFHVCLDSVIQRIFNDLWHELMHKHSGLDVTDADAEAESSMIVVFPSVQVIQSWFIDGSGPRYDSGMGLICAHHVLISTDLTISTSIFRTDCQPLHRGAHVSDDRDGVAGRRVAVVFLQACLQS